MPILEIEQKFSYNLSTLATFIRKTNFRPSRTSAFHDTYYDSNNRLSAAGLWVRRRRYLSPPSFSSSFTLEFPTTTGIAAAATNEERDEQEVEEKEEWEAKLSLQPGSSSSSSSFLRSTFSETKDRTQISSLVRAHCPMSNTKGFDDAFGLDAIAAFATKRLILTRIPNNTIVTTNTTTTTTNDNNNDIANNDDKFTIVLDTTNFGHDVGEVEVIAQVSADADAARVHEEIEAFLGRYPWFFDTGSPKGKLTAYFERFGWPK